MKRAPLPQLRVKFAPYLCVLLGSQVGSARVFAAPGASDAVTSDAVTSASAAGQNASDAASPIGCPLDGSREAPRVRCHDRFFFEAELGVSWLWMSSNFSVSNGFAQAIPSSAFGVGPSFGWQMGGSPWPGLVIGGRSLNLIISGLNVDTLNQQLYLPDLQLVLSEIGPFVVHYFDPGEGTFIRGSVNLGILASKSSQTDAESKELVAQRPAAGASLMLGAGHELWLAAQWSLGAAVDLHYFQGLGANRARALVPSASAVLTLH